MNRVWIDARALDAMLADIRRWNRWRETGGPLIGYQSGDDTVVACALSMGQHAVRARARFEPSTSHVQALIDRTHQRSQGRYRYVGSWHTHPGGSATPSHEDVATARGLAAEDGVRLPQPLLIIAGTSRLPTERRIRDVGAWRWRPTDARLDKCEVLPCVLSERFCIETD